MSQEIQMNAVWKLYGDTKTWGPNENKWRNLWEKLPDSVHSNTPPAGHNQELKLGQ